MGTNKVLIFLCIINLVHCEEQNSQTGNATKVPTFAENIKNKLDKTLQPGIRPENFLRLIKRKCEINGTPYAYMRISDAFEEISLCLERVFISEGAEIYENYQTNDDIEWFCTKTTAIEEYINDTMVLALRPCLTAEEDRYLDNEVAALHDVLEFACFNEGQRIKEFVTQGVLNCFYSHQYVLQKCIERDYSDATQLTSDNITDELFGKTNCAKTLQWRDCARSVFRQCSLSSPAIFVESLFDIVLRRVPCNGQTEATTDHGEKSKPKEAQAEFLDCRGLSEFDAAGIIVSKKLAKMDPAQAIYAETLIHAILRRGLLKEMTKDTGVCEGRPTRARHYG